MSVSNNNGWWWSNFTWFLAGTIHVTCWRTWYHADSRPCVMGIMCGTAVHRPILTLYWAHRQPCFTERIMNDFFTLNARRGRNPFRPVVGRFFCYRNCQIFAENVRRKFSQIFWCCFPSMYLENFSKNMTMPKFILLLNQSTRSHKTI